jgi:hypothetical protein
MSSEATHTTTSLLSSTQRGPQDNILAQPQRSASEWTSIFTTGWGPCVDVTRVQARDKGAPTKDSGEKCKTPVSWTLLASGQTGQLGCRLQ